MFARPTPGSPLRQGEILTGLRRSILAIDTVGNEEAPSVSFESHPFVVVLTQDCDLDLDRKARDGVVKPDKVIPDVLLCMAVMAEELKGSPGMNPRIWEQIKSYGHERYYLTGEVPAEVDLCQEGVPSLGLDFKRHFSMPTQEVYRRIEMGEARRRAFLQSPYLEHFSSRFARFQSRVALPETLAAG